MKSSGWSMAMANLAASAGLLLASFPAGAATAPSTWGMPECKSAAMPKDTATLLASGDIAALLAATPRTKRGSPDADLLNGILASYLLDDGAAATRLERYLARPRAPLAYYAGQALGGVEIRRGRYAKAAAALGRALSARSLVNATPADLLATQQTEAVAKALAKVPAQLASGKTAGALPVFRDIAGLPTGDVSIGGHLQRVVLDTGANLSVTVKSKAAALGLRVLPGEVTVASPVAPETKAQLAIADEVEVRGATFRNVVFIVFPDEALTFAKGAYKIEAILGFPVLSQLGRLHFTGDALGERLEFRRSASRPPVTGQANLFIEDLTPKVVACSARGRVAIQFALDSGAQTTSLRPLFGETFPDLVTNAAGGKALQGGAGGVIERSTRIVPLTEIDFGGTVLSLRDLEMSEESLSESGDHGRLGQDVLRAKGGYVIDFTRMRFELASDGDAPGDSPKSP